MFNTFSIMLKKVVQRIYKWFVTRFRADAPVLYEGLYLPPPKERPCSVHYKDNEFYVSSAKNDAKRLVSLCGLKEDTPLIDIGSGKGRLATGLLCIFPRFESYTGIDIHRPSVEWCQKYITAYNSCYQFIHLDVMNLRYNPTGAPIDENFRLPFEKSRFGLAYLYSVFTHMLDSDIKAYLRELNRILLPAGKVWLTAFTEEDVPFVTENPPNYQTHLGLPAPKGRLFRVRYEVSYFNVLLEDAGFDIAQFDYNSETTTGQSSYVITKVTAL